VAEIPIERKQGRSIWPWIIALIIIIALIWYFMSRRNNNNNGTTPGRTDSAMITTTHDSFSIATFSAAPRREALTDA
jgi:hypothetical protein